MLSGLAEKSRIETRTRVRVFLWAKTFEVVGGDCGPAFDTVKGAVDATDESTRNSASSNSEKDATAFAITAVLTTGLYSGSGKKSADSKCAFPGGGLCALAHGFFAQTDVKLRDGMERDARARCED